MKIRAIVALLPLVCLAGVKGAGAAADTANSGSTAGLEEIIVTAEKHTEDVQSTPMAVTVLDPGALANKGVTDLLKLNNAVHRARNQFPSKWIRDSLSHGWR